MQTPSLKTRCIFILTALSALNLSACSESTKADAATQPPPAPAVRVIEVQPKSVPLSAELPGRTTPYLIAEVRPQVSGIIQKRLFAEGSEVKAGQQLYQIDPGTYQANYASAKAALEKAQANVASTQTRMQRMKDLVVIKAASQQETDDALASFKQAQADVAAAKAAVNNANINLAYTHVKAPITGRVGRSNVTPGALVQQGQAQTMTTIQRLDPIYVDLTQSSMDLLKLKQSLSNGSLQKVDNKTAKVKLLLEDGSEYPLEGKLEFSDVSVDQSTGSVSLRAIFPNPKEQLLPGMYVRAVIEQGVRDNAILVPQKGISRDATGSAVALVLNKDNIVEQKKVKTGQAIGDQWVINEGLNTGDRVIVEGIQKVKPGKPATLMAAPAPKNTPHNNSTQE